MSNSEIGEILKKVDELPPMQKERALGFLQGLSAASKDTHRGTTTDQAGDQKKPDGTKGG